MPSTPRVLRWVTSAVFVVVALGWLFVATFLTEYEVGPVLGGLSILLPSVALTGLGALLGRRGVAVGGREALAILLAVAGAIYFLWAWAYVVGEPAATLLRLAPGLDLLPQP